MNQTIAKTLLLAAAVLLSSMSTADAKGFRMLKKQKADIVKVERKVKRSKLHPEVKSKLLKAITKSKDSLATSDYQHKRVYTRVTRTGATLVFDTGPQRSLTLYFNSRGGGDAQIFQYFSKSKSAFRTRALSSDLTLSYSSKTDSNYNATESFGVYSKSRKAKTPMSARLWKPLNYDSVKRGALVPELSLALEGAAPKGLTLSRGKVKATQRAQRAVVVP